MFLLNSGHHVHTIREFYFPFEICSSLYHIFLQFILLYSRPIVTYRFIQSNLYKIVFANVVYCDGLQPCTATGLFLLNFHRYLCGCIVSVLSCGISFDFRFSLSDIDIEVMMTLPKSV